MDDNQRERQIVIEGRKQGKTDDFIKQAVLRDRANRQLPSSPDLTPVAGYGSDGPKLTDGAKMLFGAPIKMLRNIGAASTIPDQLLRIAITSKLNPQKGAEMASNFKNPFISQDELQQINDDPRKAITEQGLKPAAGTLAWGVPGGEGIPGMIMTGATAGGLTGYSSSQYGDEIPGTIKGGIVGGIVGPVVGKGTELAGKYGSKALGAFGDLLENSGAKGFAKTTAGQFEKAINEHGIDLNKSITKYLHAGDTIDNLIGNASERGTGGRLGMNLKLAEDKIQNRISESGNTIVAKFEDLSKPIEEQIAKLQRSPVGNQGKIEQLNGLLNEIKMNYKKGVTAQQLLDIKRAADEAFGKAVVSEEKGAVNTQVQKMLGNKSRSILKKEFGDIGDALDTQSEIYTLQSVLGKAKGIVMKQGPMAGISPAKPWTWLNPITNTPRVSSTINQAPSILSRGVNMLPRISPSNFAKGASIVGASMLPSQPGINP